MITIKDIANKLNISHSVVSRALNPNPDKNARVSPKTRELVEKTASEMGFRRNRIAEFMNRGRAATIGVFLPRYSNRLIADLMMGISEAAAEKGFPLSFYFGLDYDCYEKFILDNIRNPGSGIISYPYNITQSPKLRKLLDKYVHSGGNVLLLNSNEDIDIIQLNMDEKYGSWLAAECLLEHECDYYLVENSSDLRAKSFVAFIEGKGYFDCCKIISSDDFAGEFSKVRREYARIGVFATIDMNAAAFLPLIKAEGAEFGNDVFLVGYDDLDLSVALDPPLTTVHQPFYEQGVKAVEKLFNMVYGKEEQNAKIEPFLIRRDTA